MKQVFLTTRGEIVVEHVPAPLVPDGGVLVRTVASVISSGTESTTIQQGNLFRRAIRSPQVARNVLKRVTQQGVRQTLNHVQGRVAALTAIGYSSAGVVVGVGEGVDDLHIGDRVACAGANYANHAEYTSVPRNLVVPVPATVGFADAAFTTLGAIALQGIRRAQLTLGETAVVIGLGLLGQLAVQMLVQSGVRVIGVDLVPERVALAKQNGAIEACTPAEQDVEYLVGQLTAGQGADAVLIYAGSASSQIINDACTLARRKGRVVVIGAVGMDIDRNKLYEKELDLLISTSYGPGRYDGSYEQGGIDYPLPYVRWTENRNMEAFVQLLQAGRLQLAPLISATYTLDDAPHAYERVTGRPQETLGVVLDYGAPDVAAPPVRTVVVHPAQTRAKGIRFALVGAGSFALSVHLPNLARITDIQLQAIVSATGQHARQAALRYGATYCTTDYGEVLADPTIDAVLIATRHHLHASQTLAAIRAGKQVFVEKPLGLTLEECQKVYDAAIERGVVVAVGFNRRFAPCTLQARKLLQATRGPKMIVCRVNAGALPRDHWTVDPLQGGGRILGEAVHFIDLLRYLVGAEVTACWGSTVGGGLGQTVDRDNLSASLRFADGSTAALVYTTVGNSATPKERVEIFCDGGTLIIDDFQHLSVSGLKGEEVHLPQTDKGHLALLHHFADVLAGRVPLAVTAYDGLEATRLALELLHQHPETIGT